MGPEIIICISEAKEHFAMITKDVKLENWPMINFPGCFSTCAKLLRLIEYLMIPGQGLLQICCAFLLTPIKDKDSRGCM
jgi:hypothetical protein